MMPMNSLAKINASRIASYILAFVALLIVLKIGLLVALYSGLLVYSLVHLVAPRIEQMFNSRKGRLVAVVLLSTLIISTLTLALWIAFTFFSSDSGNVHLLLKRMADIIEASRNQLPTWMRDNLPSGVDALRDMLSNWLRTHAGEAKVISQEAGHVLVHLLLGMIIGSMVALQDFTRNSMHGALAAALQARISNLAKMFKKIVFAQVRISLINTLLTAIYLWVLLPAADVHLPLVKTMIAITFLVGLIPVLGNIMSNTVIVIVALSHSLETAAFSLLFMVIIHKLEYFLNAKIIGTEINAHAWELLTAILVMETLFGLPGLVAAPVFYAYLKKELRDKGLV